MSKMLITIKNMQGVRYREHPTRRHGARLDRYYTVRFSLDGIRKEEGLGWASQGWTQQKAAEYRAEMIKSAKAGGPRTRKHIREERNKEMNFEQAFREYWDVELSNIISGAEGRRAVLKDVMPYWKDRRITEITRRDIINIIGRIRARGSKVQADRVLSRLSRFFTFMIERGVLDESPATKVKKDKETGVLRERYLSEEEIEVFWAALEPNATSNNIHPVTKLALKLVLLTGCRATEVCGAEWKEFDFEKAIWTIPAERMKAIREKKEPHEVPITPLMKTVIDEAKKVSQSSSHLFCISSSDDKTISRHTLVRAISRLHKKIGIDESFCTHDLRRTVRTHMTKIGVLTIVAEKVIAHKLPMLPRIYDKHDYLPEKRIALEAWERKLREIVGLEPMDVLMVR